MGVVVGADREDDFFFSFFVDETRRGEFFSSQDENFCWTFCSCFHFSLRSLIGVGTGIGVGIGVGVGMERDKGKKRVFSFFFVVEDETRRRERGFLLLLHKTKKSAEAKEKTFAGLFFALAPFLSLRSVPFSISFFFSFNDLGAVREQSYVPLGIGAKVGRSSIETRRNKRENRIQESSPLPFFFFFFWFDAVVVKRWEKSAFFLALCLKMSTFCRFASSARYARCSGVRGTRRKSTPSSRRRRTMALFS